MAASSYNAVRVRLYFDYPPPGMPDCRMSWVLVDLNKCRVVADLCSVIAEKFDYSRKTVLDLFIEDCFLPPGESIYVVRDNDSIRVKISDAPFEQVGKKRCRDEDGSNQAPTKKNRHETPEANGFAQPAKKKKKHKGKKKKRLEPPVECGDSVNAAVAAKEPSCADKSSKKASGRLNGNAVRSDSGEEVDQNPSSNKSKRCTPVTAPKRPADDGIPVKKPPEPAPTSKSCTQERLASSVPPKSSTKKARTESSSDSSSSQDEASSAARKLKSTNATSKAKPQTKQTSSSSSSSEDDDVNIKSSVEAKSASSSNKAMSSVPTRPASNKPSTFNKNLQKSKSQTSSDSSSSSEDEACKAGLPATPKPPRTENVENAETPCTPVGTVLREDVGKAERSESSSSSSDTELVIKKPNPQLMAGLTPRGRGRGFPDRVKGRGGVRGGFGRARGTPWKQNFHYNYDTDEQRQRTEIQTNKSILLQERIPMRDYTTLPLLAAPPAVGQKIAFKLLELTENYTPEVSDYKEAKLIGFNYSTSMVELELLTHSQARAEPGKFDLVYQNPDGSDRVEYAVTVGSQLTERWESLLEPRLIVQNAD